MIRKIFVFSFLFYFILGCTSVSTVNKTASLKKPKYSKQVEYSNFITEKEIKKYVSFLSSDELEGRKTGEKGQKTAAMYIATEFEDYGLEPVVKNDGKYSYFQKFDIANYSLEKAMIKVDGKEYKDNFICISGLDFEGNINEVELVFVPNKENVDFKKLKNKAILTFYTSKGRRTDVDKFTSNAINNEVKAIFYLLDSKIYDRYYRFRDHISKVTNFKGKLKKNDYLPKFFISSTDDEMIKTLSGESLSQLIKKSNKKPLLPLKKIKYSQKFSKKLIKTENVLGYLEGDEKKDELIVITAHYDHLGMEGDLIYNGADDNASGTSSIMTIAKAFAKAKEDGHTMKRSLLFMAVSAEEMGLWGSEYYVTNPIFPLKNVVCNLNIDMIGRIGGEYNEPNYVYIIGSDKISNELHQINENANSKYVKLKLDYQYNREDDPNRFYYRSDHYNFAKNNIPIIFYFNGVHDDYHKPTDTKEKVIFSKIEKISKLVFHTAWDVSSKKERLKLNK